MQANRPASRSVLYGYFSDRWYFNDRFWDRRYLRWYCDRDRRKRIDSFLLSEASADQNVLV